MAQIRLEDGDTIILGDYEISYKSLIGLIARISSESPLIKQTSSSMQKSKKSWIKPAVRDIMNVNIEKPKPKKPTIFLVPVKKLQKDAFARKLQILYEKYYGKKKTLTELKGSKKDENKQHIERVSFKENGKKRAAYLYVVKGKSKDVYTASDFSKKEDEIYLSFAES